VTGLTNILQPQGRVPRLNSRRTPRDSVPQARVHGRPQAPVRSGRAAVSGGAAGHTPSTGLVRELGGRGIAATVGL